MLQTIIVYVIIVLAIIYTVYAVLKNVHKKETSACGDCNGCDIKREITKNLKIAPKDPDSCGCNETPVKFAKAPGVSKDPATCGCTPEK
jgi:hypothetical protein